MNCNEIRNSFLDFFKSKSHKIVPSAPMVIKNDSTLMFTNAGMNQFKEIFLGNLKPEYNRVADSQKCLRVSGKHNDLEEVGRDTYHHTMFEMLGNWSFGDYFKKEAIEYGWEFLTSVIKLDPNRLYVTVFEGDNDDKTEKDMESYAYWKNYLPEAKILFGNKKDNFWEMGETGPCGPCSEIHIDLRNDDEREKIDGAELVNKNNPLVIEIWNLVFIQFNRLASGKLQYLENKHVDTGMGFERLCMAVQGKTSNYDTDIFQPLIQQIALAANKKYGQSDNTDIAMRVIADHLRAVSFAIADGQMPSNTGAGYVIRRILRRAIRYGFTFLDFKQPFIFTLVDVLVKQMGDQYPELQKQKKLIENIINEEENSFLRTLEKGITKFENYINSLSKNDKIEGKFAFELFDTYGFPIDLTQLMAMEKNNVVDMDEFTKCLEEQKQRSKNAASIQTEDWIELIPNANATAFIGYDTLESSAKIVKYRKIVSKGKKFYQIVLNQTPFYAESGGQIGDTGVLENSNEKVIIENTLKENNLIVHISNDIPENVNSEFIAKVNATKRIQTQNNHSATHILHYALKKVLGAHVEQKGSLVTPERLRFDFSHFSKLTDEQILEVENIANNFIRLNKQLHVYCNVPIEEAKAMGAIALFGEKYGNEVRVVKFEDSIELCGGTHTSATGNIGMIKVVSESAIAAGVRRIEAVTGKYAEEYLNTFVSAVNTVKTMLNNANIINAVEKMQKDNENLKKEIEKYQEEQINQFVKNIENQKKAFKDFFLINSILHLDPSMLKMAAMQLRNNQKIVTLFATDYDNKSNVIVAISDDLLEKYNANTMIKSITSMIQGGGGGQAGLALAGGKNINAISEAMDHLISLL